MSGRRRFEAHQGLLDQLRGLAADRGWHGRFLAIGGGGTRGGIGYAGMKDALSRGYATASTDGGNLSDGRDGSFALGHPEKIADWAYRAVHVMTEAAKAVTDAFYGRAPRYSYFTGCSTGGHQGLAEAQRFPKDYDGILAGAPGNNATHLHTAHIWTWNTANRSPAFGREPASRARSSTLPP